ncbi:MAG TPA: Spy/CpxP family protein refolding chaperone [Stellaceae bacterium]
MLKLIDPAARRLAMPILLGIAVLASPALAQTNTPASMLAQADTQAAPPPSAGQPTARTRRSPTDRAEARVKQLHDQLQITAAQEPQWNAVAQAMRDDAKAMQAVIDKRRQSRDKMSAVDDLRAYQEVAQTHLAGLQKLIPTFQALYDTMSPEQKKNADAVFSHQRRGRRAPQAPRQQ